ncbi:MAG: DUF362 domain-containing protein [candidate division Zixibacteria bacterium]|nr:DUF362 domain-containing protein [candidate division Zixibacteria bacterium]
MPVYDGLRVYEVREDLYFARGIRDAAPLRELFRMLAVAEGPAIIKVNWFSPYPGQFTDAATLALACDAIEGEKIVVEGHAAERNDGSREITPDNGRENWDWIKEQEKEYLRRFGLDAVLARDDVTYVNVTDEVWAGRAVPEDEVRAALEGHGSRLALDGLYGALPEKLVAWRGRPLVSLARVKVSDPRREAPGFSLSLKNMFGLIPEPNRGAYHERLPEAITDVCLLYGAFFRLVGVCEGIFHAVRVREGGAHDTSWGDRYDDVEDLGIVVAGAKAAEADAFAAALFGLDISARAVMTTAEERLGPWDKMVVLEASRYGLEI